MQSIIYTYIPKQETQILKGVAILMMLFLHLFGGMEDAVLCNNYMFIGDTPLVHILTRACNPVSFFLILGGYGMYIVYKKGDKHRYSRIVKLYIHYWIINFIFVGIGHFMYPEIYPGTFNQILINFTAFQIDYNGALWFFFPYISLSFTSAWLFSHTERVRTRYILSFLCGLNLFTSFLISQYGEKFLYHNIWIYNPVLYLHLMFPFFLGAMAAKHSIFSLFDNYNWKLLAWPLLILIIAIRCLFKTSVFHTFYALAFLFLFIKTNKFQFVNNTLNFLGLHSMNIWMTHSWFNKYLFHEFIYGLKYPIIIYIVLVIISVICSMIINAICAPIKKLCKV